MKQTNSIFTVLVATLFSISADAAYLKGKIVEDLKTQTMQFNVKIANASKCYYAMQGKVDLSRIKNEGVLDLSEGFSVYKQAGDSKVEYLNNALLKLNKYSTEVNNNFAGILIAGRTFKNNNNLFSLTDEFYVDNNSSGGSVNYSAIPGYYSVSLQGAKFGNLKISSTDEDDSVIFNYDSSVLMSSKDINISLNLGKVSVNGNMNIVNDGVSRTTQIGDNVVVFADIDSIVTSFDITKVMFNNRDIDVCAIDDNSEEDIQLRSFLAFFEVFFWDIYSRHADQSKTNVVFDFDDRTPEEITNSSAMVIPAINHFRR